MSNLIGGVYHIHTPKILSKTNSCFPNFLLSNWECNTLGETFFWLWQYLLSYRFFLHMHFITFKVVKKKKSWNFIPVTHNWIFFLISIYLTKYLTLIGDLASSHHVNKPWINESQLFFFPEEIAGTSSPVKICSFDLLWTSSPWV